MDNQSPKCTSFEGEKDDKIEPKGDIYGIKLDPAEFVDDKTEICDSNYSNNPGK